MTLLQYYEFIQKIIMFRKGRNFRLSSLEMNLRQSNLPDFKLFDNLASIFIKSMKLFTLAILFFFVLRLNAQYHDWNMWRYDPGRTANTPERLAPELYLQWQVEFSPRIPVWDDPLNENLMQFDRLFEPVVAGGKLFLGFNDQDKVIALDLETGKELWHYYTDGPVRLPLACNNGKVYFTGDDGNCYCLDAGTGILKWKRNLAPSNLKLLGNKRMISMWPARGGIVIRDNIVYTAASIFPLMGTFIYALDAETGNIVWKNEGTGSNYILQPHKSPAFADIAPQGCFTISGKRLLVAGGRTVPAGFDLNTGEEVYYRLAESGKTGGAFTCSNDRIYFNHHRGRMTFMYDALSGEKLASDAGEYPVVDESDIYFSGNTITACRLTENKKLVKRWTAKVPANKDLIKAGNTLYAADSTGRISALELTPDGNKLVWSVNTGKPVERLLASNGKLVAVTSDGSIMVYGDKPTDKIISQKIREVPIYGKSKLADDILKASHIREGYAVVYGTVSKEFLKGLVSSSELNILVVQKEPSKVNEFREYFDSLSVKVGRLCFLSSVQGEYFLPKYFSSLTIINDPGYLNNFDTLNFRSVYSSVRPYGGRIWIKTNNDSMKNRGEFLSKAGIKGAEVTTGNGFIMITRSGALEGTADWTHNYGDISNTAKSDDKTVKAPLGILWFGGNSNLDVLPRHGHGPSEQVIDGRLIIQGVNSISARDVYTGRLLWKKVFEGLAEDTWMVYYDETYDGESPLNPKYNQEHIPGANARGTNFIATREYVYAIEGNRCHLIDIATGIEQKTFTSGDPATQKFAYIGVYDQYLLLGNNFTSYPSVEALPTDKSSPKFENFNLTASNELLVLNRFTGRKIWSLKAKYGFIHNAVIAGDGVLYCLDKLPQLLETRLKRRGESIPKDSRLLYVDIRNGKVIHEENKNIFGTWLGYSEEHKLLLQATRPSRDMLNGEDGKRMIAYNALTREILWDREIKYANPPVISNDKIYTNGEGFYLLTGEPIVEKDPVTGESRKWDFKREYGCGYVVASEHLLTFRSASAAFVNLDALDGTASLGGFKAGCSANLIVADGVLNSPDYTRTCQCPYQNQTSLAFIHMPWMNYWTNSNYNWSGKPIEKLGINLNAPGDRMSDENVLWLEYPATGTASSGIGIKLDTAGFYKVRKDPVSIRTGKNPWIAASALGGIRSMEITLAKEVPVKEVNYTVRLCFSEPEFKNEGDRIFNISIQGRKVLGNFDILKEAGQPDSGVIKSFSGIKAGNSLRIDLEPVKGNTLLSGVELIKESD